MAFLLNKSLLKYQFLRQLVNSNVYLITCKRNYLWNRQLREHNQYEYNSSELAKCLTKLDSVGCSSKNQHNLLNYLSNYLKENDFQAKDDCLLFINVINYAFKLNQTIGNVVNQHPDLNKFLAQVELHTNDMIFDELVSALIACSSINISLSSSILRRLTIAVGRKMKGFILRLFDSNES